MQDVVVKALVAHRSFEPGTNLVGWLRQIMVNHFISAVRRNREITGPINVPEGLMQAPQQDRTDIRELGAAFARMPSTQRDVLRSIVIEEKTYEDIADETGIAIGTLKSRAQRAIFICGP